MTLVLDSITKKYKSNQEWTLNDFSIKLNKNDILVIVGESGCGKTTLLKCVAGFEKPDSGKIKLNDDIMFDDDIFVTPQTRNIGMVFQDYALLPHFTVKKNILYGINKLPLFTQYRRLLKLVKLFKVKKLLNKLPHELSGGEQQRVALIRSLIIEPKILLMDEPFSSIDEKHRANLRHELRNILKSLKITTIIVTHDTQDALSLGDNVAIIDKGVLQQLGTPNEVYLKPANKYVTSFFGEAFFFEAIKTNNEFISPVGQFKPGQFKQQNKDSVNLAIRPENIEISLVPETNYNEAIINQVTFLGIHSSLSLDVRFKDEIVKIPANINSNEELKAGDKIYFKVNHKKLIEFVN